MGVAPPAPPTPWTLAGRAGVAWAGGSALVLAALGAFTPLLHSPQTAWHDLQARVFAPAAPPPSVLLLDIDEPSVEALRPRVGGWPPSRELLGRVTQRLLDDGARAVVITLVLADPREGDATLARAIAAHPGRVVLATSVLPAQAETAAPVARAPGGCLAQPWAGLLLPAPALREAGARLGMVSTPPDADGQLRAWPLWHAAPGQVLPTLPLAAWAAVQPPGTLLPRCDPLAPLPAWPRDAQGRVHPAYAARADALPRLPYLTAAQAVLDGSEAAALKAMVTGRTVVIGASAVLSDRVQTPLGPRFGPALLAEVAGAFDNPPGSRFITPPGLMGAAVAGLGLLLPLAAAWQRGRLNARDDARACAAAGLGLLLADGALYALAQEQSWVLAPLLGLACLTWVSQWQSKREALAERLRLERERAAAEAASQVKSEFLAHMSHEIRTPMNALLGSAELLAQTRLDERQSRHVALFQAAGASLMEILNDLLDLSKIEAGLLELHPQPFSLVDLVAAQMVMFEARATQRGLQLHTEVDPELPAVVTGDAPRLAQVLRNLLGNAVKFTHRGSVTLAVHRVAGAPGRLRFEVRDTGIGITASQQKTIFQAFTQADSGVARAYGGTGLGLTISAKLVALMGGEIGVSSREGEGSVFHVELTLPESRDAPVAAWAPSAPGMSGTLKPSLRLLLADDNPQNVLLVQAYLEGEGHLIDVVHDGASALERFQNARYDLVLMDVQMPGMDGYTATAALRRFERDRGLPPTPVIALTANAMPDDESRSLAAGCNSHLTKPFSRDQLRRALARQLDTAPTAGTAPSPHSGLPWPLPALAALEGFELDTALARMGGDTRLYRRVLDAARPLLANWMPRFAAAQQEAPELGSALRLAHDLKSTAATLGARRLADAAALLEQALRQGDGPVDTTPLQAPLAALLGVLERPAP